MRAGFHPSPPTYVPTHLPTHAPTYPRTYLPTHPGAIAHYIERASHRLLEAARAGNTTDMLVTLAKPNAKLLTLNLVDATTGNSLLHYCAFFSFGGARGDAPTVPAPPQVETLRE